MKALIILAHGSRKQESNQEIENLTNDVRALVKREFDIVDYAFLEIAEPSLTNSIEKVVSKNISEITIFPYFLNSGVHIKNDIPDIAIDMIQICLEMKSHSVYNSGSNTSIKGLKNLLNKTSYDSMYIFMCNRQCCSATVQNHISHTVNSLEEINKMCEQFDIDLYIGGPATKLIDGEISFKYNKFLKFSVI